MAPGYIIALTSTCFLWASHLHRIQPVHMSRLYLDIFDRMHLFLDWQLGRRSMCYNHPIIIFPPLCLHPPHTHILQIILKDNNRWKKKKHKKKLLKQQQKNKILIRRRPSHNCPANYYLNLFYYLCAVGYLDMCASNYNTDASFIIPNTTGPSVIPWRISKP